MSSTKELDTYARFLRNAAPQPFDDFCTVFEKYTGETVENMINATTNLPLAQGHAQQCAKILQILEKAKKNG